MPVTAFPVLKVGISRVDPGLAAEYVAKWVSERNKVYVCVAPVSTVVAGHDDAAYREVLNQAAMVTPDGMPLVWIAHRRGLRDVQRTYGPDLMRKLCDEGRARNYRHYLYGADELTNLKLAEALQEHYPGIRIAGRYSPPFRELTAEEERDVVHRINESGADILWVGLGSPKQDFWMARNRDTLHPPVLVGVGAAFDFLAGTKPQAPCWMRRSGLEWLFRLACEPRRLAQRYLVGNIRFIFLLLTEGLRTKTSV